VTDLTALPVEMVGAGTDDGEDAPVLSVDNLQVHFPTDGGLVKAVDGLSFTVRRNETLGLVGESGSGKSVTSLAVLGLLPKSARISGDVRFLGQSILGQSEKRLRDLRGRRIAMVFQDALAALNPVLTVGSQIAEAITVHADVDKKELRARVFELLDIVGIPDPTRRYRDYPHQYSGGMRQRAMIAMAIANEPDLLIADEPTTALDVTIQAQVLEVIERIQDRTRASVLLITHDLGVVAGLADRVLVMYAGRPAEIGTVDEIFYDPRHPYTRGLLASLPRSDRGTRGERLYRIKGQPPSLIRVPPGCAFHPRCPVSSDFDGICFRDRPSPREITPLHDSACHFAETLEDRYAAAERDERDERDERNDYYAAKRRRENDELEAYQPTD